MSIVEVSRLFLSLTLIMSNEVLLPFTRLSSLLTKTKNILVEQTGDHYAVATIKVYAGGPYELNIDYCNSDEGMSPLFYVSFDYEGDEDPNTYTGVSLSKTIKDKFKAAGYLSELQTEGVYVENSEIQRLEDIVNSLDEECCSAEFQRMAPAHIVNPYTKVHKKEVLGESSHTRKVSVDSSSDYDVPFPKDAIWISPSGLFFVRKVNGSYFLYDDPSKEEFASFSTLAAAKNYVEELESDGFEIELKPWEDPENYM